MKIVIDILTNTDTRTGGLLDMATGNIMMLLGYRPAKGPDEYIPDNAAGYHAVATEYIRNRLTKALAEQAKDHLVKLVLLDEPPPELVAIARRLGTKGG
jgi:hypothetical protein